MCAIMDGNIKALIYGADDVLLFYLKLILLKYFIVFSPIMFYPEVHDHIMDKNRRIRAFF